jgi:hypothetical protein
VVRAWQRDWQYGTEGTVSVPGAPRS